MLALSQWERAQAVLEDYDDLFSRSRSLQLQFNVALFFISLLIVGIVLWIALVVADRLVRPVSDLVHAAKRVTDGDLAARVPGQFEKDEIGTLGRAFNRMTERLEMQTTALITANEQLGNRRAFIETVLESVTAGIISLNKEAEIRLINSQAQALLYKEGDDQVGAKIGDIAPEFASLIDEGVENTIIQFSTGPEVRTLAVKIVSGSNGHVITFEDITQQLLDQRRAAWSDVARRIAHEIKNPLTPIQLAAERLQRRFGKAISDDESVFAQLTGTSVRQVGDLRNIVDEFSSFARMPKPVFRRENLIDVLKQAMFMQDVAHPQIEFEFAGGEGPLELVCDRRQLGQAFTNIMKNAVEAIQSRVEQGGAFETSDGHVKIFVDDTEKDLSIAIEDNGIGLPADRERIVEPYMTTREKGTGLGLAIVKKIVEEHFGEIAFDDAPDHGTRVTISFNKAQLQRMDTDAEPAEHGDDTADAPDRRKTEPVKE